MFFFFHFIFFPLPFLSLFDVSFLRNSACFRSLFSGRLLALTAPFPAEVLFIALVSFWGRLLHCPDQIPMMQTIPRRHEIESVFDAKGNARALQKCYHHTHPETVRWSVRAIAHFLSISPITLLVLVFALVKGAEGWDFCRQTPAAPITSSSSSSVPEFPNSGGMLWRSLSSFWMTMGFECFNVCLGPIYALIPNAVGTAWWQPNPLQLGQLGTVGQNTWAHNLVPFASALSFFGFHLLGSFANVGMTSWGLYSRLWSSIWLAVCRKFVV